MQICLMHDSYYIVIVLMPMHKNSVAMIDHAYALGTLCTYQLVTYLEFRITRFLKKL